MLNSDQLSDDLSTNQSDWICPKCKTDLLEETIEGNSSIEVVFHLGRDIITCRFCEQIITDHDLIQRIKTRIKLPF